MRWILLSFFFSFCIGSCNFRQREEELQKREAALNQKEQELLLKEKTLRLQEEELAKQRRHIDSTLKADTTGAINPALTGEWSAKMTCTETTCSGSAVGDTKTEQWSFSYEGTNLLAKATANGQLVRVYSGVYKDNAIELAADQSVDASTPSAKMAVYLTVADATHLEGRREIIRENECRIVYDLKLEKQ
jgi:hypothetical protein